MLGFLPLPCFVFDHIFSLRFERITLRNEILLLDFPATVEFGTLSARQRYNLLAPPRISCICSLSMGFRKMTLRDHP